MRTGRTVIESNAPCYFFRGAPPPRFDGVSGLEGHTPPIPLLCYPVRRENSHSWSLVSGARAPSHCIAVPQRVSPGVTEYGEKRSRQMGQLTPAWIGCRRMARRAPRRIEKSVWVGRVLRTSACSVVRGRHKGVAAACSCGRLYRCKLCTPENSPEKTRGMAYDAATATTK
jgi:hypothetical protein